MPEEPIEVVRRLTGAFNAFDVDAVIELCHPDVVVVENPYFPDSGTYRGHDGVRRMLAGWAVAFTDRRARIDEIVADGDTVTVTGSYEGVGPLTGVRVGMRQVAVYVVRDGKAVSATFRGEAES
jgi:ketosteroid isomerase-like protein